MSALEFLHGCGGCSCVLSRKDISLYVDQDVFVWIVFDLKGRAVNVVNVDLLAQAEEVLNSFSKWELRFVEQQMSISQ
jgi:proteasome lid subunit RPN8/RPN11